MGRRDIDEGRRAERGCLQRPIIVTIRSAVDQILAFNKYFPREQLKGKLEKLSASPFTFFRSTFHLFARDLTEWSQEWPLMDVRGPIIGDLHTENFGAFRAVTGEIVYDINDFDEATNAPYDVDLRRLSTSILLAALDNGHSFGTGVREAELSIRSWLEAISRFSESRSRKKLERLCETAQILELLHNVGEKSRTEFIGKMTQQVAPGRFVFRQTDRMLPVGQKILERAQEAIPSFLANVLAPVKARPMEYTFQDIAFRFGGAGSLGRARYALLFNKEKQKADLSTLRLIEWKDSLDSSLDSSEPRFSHDRAQQVFDFTRSFQLLPKRYLGYAMLGNRPMQAKEIGANDARFNPKSMQDREHFQQAAEIFGKITARAHMLGSVSEPGPQLLVRKLQSREDRFVHKLLSFAVAYADRVFDDFDELTRRKAEVEEAWRARAR